MVNEKEQQAGQSTSTGPDDATRQTPTTTHADSRQPLNFVKLENACIEIDVKIIKNMLKKNAPVDIKYVDKLEDLFRCIEMSEEEFSEIIGKLEERSNYAPDPTEQQHSSKEMEIAMEKLNDTRTESDSGSESHQPKKKRAKKVSPKSDAIMRKYREALCDALCEANLLKAFDVDAKYIQKLKQLKSTREIVMNRLKNGFQQLLDRYKRALEKQKAKSSSTATQTDARSTASSSSQTEQSGEIPQLHEDLSAYLSF